MAPDDFDPYAVLGLEPSAPPALLEAGYVQMRLRHRHDPEKLAEIESAYRMLIDPEQRQAYAELRAASLPRIELPEHIDAVLAQMSQPGTYAGQPAAVAQQEPPPATVAESPWNFWDMLKAIGVVILGTVIAAIPMALIAESLLEEGQENEDDPIALMIVLSVSFVLELLLLGTAIWFGPRKYGLPIRALGLHWPTRGDTWFRVWFPVALSFAALGVVFAYFSVLALFGVEPDPDLPEEVFDNPGPFIILALVAVGFAPFMEEVFFRGFIFGGLRVRWGWAWAAIGSGALFGLAHISNPGTAYVVPPIAGIGFLFAWARNYSGSITSSIIAHFIYNSISVGLGFAASTVWLSSIWLHV